MKCVLHHPTFQPGPLRCIKSQLSLVGKAWWRTAGLHSQKCSQMSQRDARRRILPLELLPLLIYCQNKWIPAAITDMGFRFLAVFPCWDNYSWMCAVQRNTSGCFLRINIGGGRRCLQWPTLTRSSTIQKNNPTSSLSPSFFLVVHRSTVKGPRHVRIQE